MGVYYGYCLGPYIQAKNPMLDTEVFRTSCTNTKCKNHSREIWSLEMKFCPICGSKVDKIYAIKKCPKICYWELVEETDLRTVTYNQQNKGIQYFATNTSGLYGRESSSDSRECSLIEITQELIAKELDIFKEVHAKDIEKLKEAYGEENIEIKWGLIHYAN